MVVPEADPNLPEVDASSRGQPVPGSSSGASSTSSSSGGMDDSGSDATSQPPSDGGVDAAPADAYVPPPKPAQGEVLVTEIMYDTLGAEPSTEWFEVYNTTASARTLSGLVIKDGGNRTHVIAGNVVLAGKSYGVFVRDKNVAMNTSKVPAAAILYEYGTGLPDNAGVQLANGDSGGLWLAFGATTISQAPYGGWYSQSGGSSIQLKALTYADGAKKDSWCVSFNPWTTGSAKGTPGGAEDCP